MMRRTVSGANVASVARLLYPAALQLQRDVSGMNRRAAPRHPTAALVAPDAQRHLVRRCCHAAWRNGGGVTRELLTWPGGQAWAVRMSVADVHAPGPFSRFDGIERWFAVLEGAGVELRVGGGAQRLDRTRRPCSSTAARRSIAPGGRPHARLQPDGAPGKPSRMLRRVRAAGFPRRRRGALLAVYAHEQPAARCSWRPRCRWPPATWPGATAPGARTASPREGALWMEAQTHEPAGLDQRPHRDAAAGAAVPYGLIDDAALVSRTASSPGSARAPSCRRLALGCDRARRGRRAHHAGPDRLPHAPGLRRRPRRMNSSCA
jgi:hypothetical protein